MKPLLLTIALLFSTPAWAVRAGCFFKDENFVVNGNVTFDKVKEKIRKNKHCDVIQVEGINANSTSTVQRLCRFDREIVFSRGKEFMSKKTYFLCVPKR